MKHFTDAIFEDLIVSQAACLADYKDTVDYILRRAPGVDYDDTPRMGRSSYILPTGILVNGPIDSHASLIKMALSCIPSELRDNISEDDPQVFDYIYGNVVRLNSGRGYSYIYVNSFPQLTTAQLQTLKTWLDRVLYASGRIEVCIADLDSGQQYFCGILNLTDYDTDGVVNFIKYVQNNKRPPSNAVWEALEIKN
jgi:hypothetical protein